MEHPFWHNKWETGQLGFHQENINSRLVRHWPRLGLNTADRVLVPLCGKSLDMAWLAAGNFRVLGLELSEIACRDFFRENGLDPERMEGRRFTRFVSADIQLWCGDFFDLDSTDTGNVAAVYDRAALVALPTHMRKRYAGHMGRLLAPSTPLLLISMDYDERQMNGPPFSVPEQEVRELFAADFSIEVLSRASGPDIVGNLSQRGLKSLNEIVYMLKKLP